MKKLFIIAALALSLAGCLAFGPLRGGHDRWGDDQRQGQYDRHDDHHGFR